MLHSTPLQKGLWALVIILMVVSVGTAAGGATAATSSSNSKKDTAKTLWITTSALFGVALVIVAYIMVMSHGHKSLDIHHG
jgi:uncharacterized membrane protein